MKISRDFRIVGFLIGAFFFWGCSTTYTPKTKPADLATIPKFQAQSSVALINAQAATEVVRFSDPSLPTVKGSLNAWTSASISGIKRTLENAGVRVDEHAAKQLKVAITKVAIFGAKGGFGWMCKIELNVEPTGGVVFALTTTIGSWKMPPACNNAVNSATKLVLNDERVVKFLTGQ